MIIFLFTLLIPFVCFSKDESIFGQLLINVNNAKTFAFKKQNFLMPHVFSCTSSTPTQKLLTYPFPEMAKVNVVHIKSFTKEQPQNLESRIRIERVKMEQIRKSEAPKVKLKKSEAKFSSKFCFVNPEANEFNLIPFVDKTKKDKFDTQVLEKAKKINGRSIIQDFDTYFSAINNKNISLSDKHILRNNLCKAINSSATNPQIVFFDTTNENKKNNLFKISDTTLKSLVLLLQKKNK